MFYFLIILSLILTSYILFSRICKNPDKALLKQNSWQIVLLSLNDTLSILQQNVIVIKRNGIK